MDKRYETVFILTPVLSDDQAETSLSDTKENNRILSFDGI